MLSASVSEKDRRAIQDSFRKVAVDSRFVDLSMDPDFVLDLRYACENNFMGKNVYGEMSSCFLHRDAATMLKEAASRLSFLQRGVRLLLFDGLRPGSAQNVLWEHVVGTAEQKYVANPAKGSIHSYGLAIDLSLVDADGNEMDMGTVFDHFDELAEPRREDSLLKAGRLTETQIGNRRLLREAMLEAGFHLLPHEWWHFDAFPPDEVRKSYQIVP